MTGNQYFIVILAMILAYFIINMVSLYIQDKEARNQERKIMQISRDSERLYKENKELRKIIEDCINGKL